MNKNTMIRNLTVALITGMALPTVGAAQNMFKGTVVNSSTHEKFAGARITIVGTQQIAMSDETGSFEFKNIGQDCVLKGRGTWMRDANSSVAG